MSISIPQLKKILISKDINHLYHVNTVATSITYIQNGGLISRGAVEDKGLFQTPQESDEKDKEVSVFYDIFFDTDDIHARRKAVNFYGAITFEFSIDVLDSLGDKIVKATKDNPIRWSKDMPEEKRYFTDEIPMSFEFHKGTFQQHITICDMHESLPFEPYLTRVLIENPKTEDTTHFDKAYKAIHGLLQKRSLPDLEARKCPDNCGCHSTYTNAKKGYSYYRFMIR